MNKKRRSKLEMLYGQICDIVDRLRDILTEERDAFDNIPENLQDSELASSMDEAIDSIESACDSLNDALGSIREVIE